MAIATSDGDPRSKQAAPPLVPESGGQDEPEYGRIPDLRLRFVDDVGTGFALGMTGSSAYNLITGLFSGGGGGLAGAARAVSASAPRAAGSLAAYFAVYSATESAMSLARRKEEDPWNDVAAGAAAWAALGLRRGAAGAAVVALAWGAQIVGDLVWEATPPEQPARPMPAAAPAGRFLGIPRGPPVEVKKVPAAAAGF